LHFCSEQSANMPLLQIYDVSHSGAGLKAWRNRRSQTHTNTHTF